MRPVTVDPVPHEELALWNATVAAHHPLGLGQPFGAYQRYWIHSRAEGTSRVPGAMLFAAPAKKVADRDLWIGWTGLERQRFRYRLVSNSRFLILPGVRVPHLANHVPGIAARRLRVDWIHRYGYAPVLPETFVTPPNKGICCRAANWRFIGESASSSRSSRRKKANNAIKMIFVYPLIRGWRSELCVPMPVVDEEDDFNA